jgi:anti-sigma B factor antagonist
MQVVSHTTRGDVGILTIEQARLLDDTNLGTLQKQLLELLDKADEKKIVVDFRLVEFVSSAGLGMLIRIKKRCSEEAKELRICSLEPTVAETIQITGLDQLFQISEDADKAIADLGSAG